ncbi:MAG: pirin family protein [Rhodospirillales bacterium]|nr:pirin family protein [Rhodospirillales bacterium]MBN8897363.1 pirin family protein [Rhodospirillales bacterium]
MIDLRPFATLGGYQNGWLSARHHFSFGAYREAARMGFGRLLVWNDDEVAPGQGFDPHPHRDMEIVTYVRQGAITHRDSLGNEGRTEAGDVQVMHAGSGIVHAEYNLEHEPTRLFQIWIQPDRAGVAPGWATRRFPRCTGLNVLASGRVDDAVSGALPLHADAQLRVGVLRAGESARLTLGTGRGLYLVPATGAVTVNGVAVGLRDGAAISDEPEVAIMATKEADLVAVEVAL